MNDALTTLALSEQTALAHPKDPAALGNLGIMLSRLGRLEEAEIVLRRALALAPANPLNRLSLGITLLSLGRFAEGWPFYAARTEIAATAVALPKQLKAPRWSGEPLEQKRILVIPEQGLGDQIQFSRLIPDLTAAGAHVTLVSHMPLRSLFEVSFPDIEHVMARRFSELPDADYWISLIDLPAILNTVPEALPKVPYLRTTATWKNPPSGLKIGLMTEGNPQHPNNTQRSLTSEQAKYLRSHLPGQLISLDPLKTGASSFAETAAIVREVDLVVSVDTASAHLAGAMGKRCFLLVPGFGTDWRWMRGRADSPWYPNHTLYRGRPEGGWGDAIDRLLADAQFFAAGLDPSQFSRST